MAPVMRSNTGRSFKHEYGSCRAKFRDYIIKTEFHVRFLIDDGCLMSQGTDQTRRRLQTENAHLIAEVMHPIVITIPARNEEDRIGACLTSIEEEARNYDGDVKVIVFANNCADQTASRAAHMASRAAIDVHVHIQQFPPHRSNAGCARAAAFALAASMANSAKTIIVSTDADSRPQPGWLAKISGAVSKGADAVAGVVEFEPGETANLRVLPVRRREAEYAGLQAQLVACLDPLDHDPFPNHIWAWGANLAVTLDAYRRVGGVPQVELAEDRAFVTRLEAFDCKVRHDPDVRVWTSTRTDGRAPGGLADLISIYSHDPTYPCDAALMPVNNLVRHARLKRKFRRAFHDRTRFVSHLAATMNVSIDIAEKALDQPFFGQGWALLREESALLHEQRLFPIALEAELHKIRRALASTLKHETGTNVNDSASLWAGISETRPRSATISSTKVE